MLQPPKVPQPYMIKKQLQFEAPAPTPRWQLQARRWHHGQKQRAAVRQMLLGHRQLLQQRVRARGGEGACMWECELSQGQGIPCSPEQPSLHSAVAWRNLGKGLSAPI